MKKTQVTDAVRNITRQIVSFLSVVIIAMLAVTIFLGIFYSSKAIANTGNDYYDKANFRDVEIVSTYNLTEDDLAALRGIEGVYDVEGAYQFPCVMTVGDIKKDVDVVSVTERINLPILIEGRLPEAANECCVEAGAVNRLDVSVGDTLTLIDTNGEKLKYLKGEEYVITGVVYHADVLCAANFIPGNRYVMVSPDAIDREALENTYTKALITLNSARGINRFSDIYPIAVNEPLSRIEQLADERAQLRYEEVYGTAQGRIDEGQSQLESAQSELSDARESLDSGAEQLESARHELSDASSVLDDSGRQLAEAQSMLESGRSQIESGEAQLDAASSELRSALATLNYYEEQATEANARIEEARAQIADADNKIAQATEFLDSFSVEINNHKDELRDTFRDALRSVIGDYADRFDWTGSGDPPRTGDPNADFTKYPVTNSLTLDLNKSFGDNIYAAIASLGIPEDELRAAFEAATGIYEELSDGTSWLDRVVEYAVERYRYYEQEYADIAECAQMWNDYNQQYIDGMAQYNAKIAEYNAGLAEYNDARARLDAKWDEYYRGLARYNSGRRQLNEARSSWESGNQQYIEGSSQYQAGQESYSSGINEYSNQSEAMISRESKYSSGVSEYEEGQQQLDKSREELIKMDQCRWVVLSAEENPSYSTILRSSQNLRDVAMTFSVVFVLVASLVIFSTLGRIIDEQRVLVGATKALGLYNREVFMKYLAFGLTGTVFGMCAGVVAAYLLIQKIILKGYSKSFIYGEGGRQFHFPLTIAVVLAGGILATVTVWFACRGLLKSTAVELMSGKIPSVKYMSKEGNGGTSHLYSKLIIRNMLCDKKRVAATIVSVTGCCALLVGGFTIQYAVQNAVKGQFEDYELYDLKIFYDTALSEDAGENVEAVLDKYNAAKFISYDTSMPIRINGHLLSLELICGDLSELNPFFNMVDADTKQTAQTDKDGIWIHHKIAEYYEIKPGDDITLYNKTMKPYRVRVAGVFENYIGWYMFMTPSSYENVFEEAPQMNMYMAKLNGADTNALVNELKETEGFKEYSDIAYVRESCDEIASVLNSVSLICIIMSAMMAYFILLNLVSMYVHQKKKELIVMRINGFTLKEVINYMAREFFVSTAIGIVFGIASGALLGLRVVKLLESDMIRFDHTIQWSGWVFSIIITMIFVVLVCIPAFRRIKHLRLADISS